MRWSGLLAAVVLLTACTGLVFESQQEHGTGPEPSAETPSAPMLPAGGLTAGKWDAPVQFVLITHHSCKYCKPFEDMFTDRLQQDFVQTGNMRLSVGLSPLRAYPQQETQVRMLYCAIQQGKGWSMHRTLFTGIPDDAALAAMDLEPAAWETCMTGAETGALLLHPTSFVPRYWINGTMYTGLPEWTQLRGQINRALAQ